MLYGYDDAGRQNQVIDPGGIVTLTGFDDLGRPVLVTENAGGTAAEQRHTAYKYSKTTGLLEKVAAVRAEGFTSQGEVDWDAVGGKLQVTRYAYDALVESNSNGIYSHVTTNGAWISAVHYPDPETGQPEAEPSVQFTYRFDGQPARRTDGRGVELKYGYDDRDRLGSITVAAASTNGLLGVDLAVDRLSYEHTSDGQLSAARTHGDGSLRSESLFGYGMLRQLTTATQSFPGHGPDQTVTYGWDLAPATGTGTGRRRLGWMTYPEATATEITFNYGGVGGIDDLLNRLTALSEETNGGSLVASWRYMGLGRQVGMSLGNGISMDYDDSEGGPVTGLDGFGRVIDIPYKAGPGAPGVLQYQYGHDPQGNRLFRRAFSSQLSALSEGDDSWLYGYDDLSRLIRASKGELNTAGSGFASGITPETSLWSLDDLGNWSAGASSVSLRTFADADADGVFDGGESVLTTDHHATNECNEIESRVTGGPGGTNPPQPFAYDGAGNLVFDGQHYFVYDAWNRVVEIHEAGTLAVVNGVLSGSPGELLARYEHDGLGRRVLSSTGILPVKNMRHVYGGGADVLAEYDVTDPQDIALLRWFVHGQTFPDPLVMADLSGTGFQPEGVPEYFYYLKDALGSVSALTDANGAIVEGYRYDPYGKTTVLRPDGTQVPVLAALPESYYFDADLDGQIEADDAEHLEACAQNTPWEPMCVFAHDADGDGQVGLYDVALFVATYDPEPNYTNFPVPATLERSTRVRFDANGNGEFEVFDWYAFHTCFGLATQPSAGLCRLVFDLDTDAAVDLDDYREFQRVYGGPGEAVTPMTNPSRYGNPLMFTGQRYDAATGFYAFWARHFRPKWAKFNQRNPLGALGTVDVVLDSGGLAPSVGPCVPTPEDEYGDGFNLYEYVGSNPASATDAYGLFITALDSLFSVAVGGDTRTALDRNALNTGAGILGILGLIGVQWAWPSIIDAIFEGVVTVARGRNITCRCTADHMPDHLRQVRGGPCPDRVTHNGPYNPSTDLGACQAAAVATAPPECQVYYQHCGWK